MALHPAETRAYRELMQSAEEARTRLRRVGGHLDDRPRGVADKASDALGEMLLALRPSLAEHDLHSEIAARGSGARIGAVRAEVLDRYLERNQALRFAVDDVEHVITLLGYVAAVSETRGKKNLPELCRNWERKIRRHGTALRRAAIELGSNPDEAIEPLDPRPIERGERVSAADTGEGQPSGTADASEEGQPPSGGSPAEEGHPAAAFDDASSNGEAAPADDAPAEEKKPKLRGFFRRSD